MQLIIPNWHPIFVHFTVALLLSATGLLLVTMLFPKARWAGPGKTVAIWNLWLGVAVTLITVATGWYAFNTVTHDDPAHVVMTEHRNLALTTLGIFLALAVLAWRKAGQNMQVGWLFTVGMLVAGGVLASTAWHGGELVYRHGLGVVALPNPAHHNHGAADHAHEHSGDELTHNDNQAGEGTAHDHQHDSGPAAAHEVEADHDHDLEHDQDHDHEQANDPDVAGTGSAAPHADGNDHSH